MPNSGLQLTWTNVLASLGAVSVMAGGAFKLIEVQFEYVQQLHDRAMIEVNRQLTIGSKDVEELKREYLTIREHNAYKQAQDDALTSLRNRLVILEATERDLIGHAAHTPVEGKEVDALSVSIDKRVELLQQQINDINRQIAASILQNGYPKNPTLLPK